MLKRTSAPFYGKRESRMVGAATAAFRSGDTDTGNRLHHSVINSIGGRYRAWESNGKRKACRSAGGRR